jgi:LPS O-antigen subunit length determinant protein (WzzB/FepE family)
MKPINMTKGIAMRVEREEFQKYEDIDLMALFKVVWVGKWKIIFVTGIAAILSVFYALSLPNIYKSEVLLTTVDATSAGGGGLGGLGGLASLAGVSIGGKGKHDVTLGLATLKSRIFLTDFITRRDILVPLMALESWDDGKIKISDKAYDLEKKAWRVKKPGLQDAYSVFMGKFTSSIDPSSGLIKLAISSQSPVLAQQWVTWLVEDLNDSIRSREVKEANRAVTFLEEKLKSTVSVDMRAMFFRLIQQQTETVMLANVKEDYLFRIVDPAIIPEIKSSPSRSVICILGTLFGGFFSVLLVFLFHFLQQKKDY